MYNLYYILSLFEEKTTSRNTGWTKFRGQTRINVISFNNSMEIFISRSFFTHIY